MAFDLDDPTVFRVGEPVLGVPLFSVDYRPGTTSAPLVPLVPIPMTPTAVAVLQQRMEALELRVALLERPWYRRLASWVRGLWSH